MIVFVVRADPSGSIGAEAFGALRRSGLVLTAPDTASWVRRWTDSVRLQPLPARGQGGELDTAVRGASVVTVVQPAAGAHLPLPSNLADASLRDLTSEGRTWLHVGGRVPASVATAWADERPLLGWTVMVTRPVHQAEALERPLRSRGARTVRFPVIRTVAPRDPRPLDQAVRSVENYDWIVFTSVNGVEAFRRALLEAGRDARSLAGCRIASIGPATAGALEDLGIRADVVPDEYVAESLLNALGADDSWEGRRVLLARAAEARSVLPDRLRAWGAEVDVVAAYRTLPDAEGAEQARRQLEQGQVDLVTFTASSTVRAFRAAVGGLGRARAVAIGPITAGTATDEGLPLAGVAEEYTMAGLVRACVRLARPDG